MKLVNGFISASGRKIDFRSTFKHSIRPMMRSTAPLKDLEPQGAPRLSRQYIHHMANFQQRLADSTQISSAFGLGAYCGFGRMPPAELPNVLADHLRQWRSQA